MKNKALIMLVGLVLTVIGLGGLLKRWKNEYINNVPCTFSPYDASVSNIDNIRNK